MNRLCSYWARIIIWIAAGVCLFVLGTKLMSSHWSSWKQVLILDDDLEEVNAFSSENPNQWLDFHSSVRLFARANNDGTVEMWDALERKMLWRRGEAVSTMPRTFRLTRPKFVGFRGDILNVLAGGSLTAYDLKGNIVHQVPINNGWFAINNRGSDYMVVGGKGVESSVVNLDTYEVKEFKGSIELSNGLMRADVSSDGKRVLLGNQGLCKVYDVENGDIVYELTKEDIQKAIAGKLVEFEHLLEGEEENIKAIVQRNTAKRNSLPTDVRMTRDGGHLIYLYANYSKEDDPKGQWTKIQFVDVKTGDLTWETLREGRCDGVHFDSTTKTFVLRHRGDSGQSLIRYQLATGLVFSETEFSIVVERPYLKSTVRRLEQEQYYVDPLNERVVFTDKQPWIARLDEKSPVLFPLFVSGADVPFVAFSRDGRVVATYSAQGTVRLFHLFGREEQGYMRHPLGWLLFFGFVLWSTWGAYLIWKWGNEERSAPMPNWLGGWLVLQCVHVGFVMTKMVATFARSAAEEPWLGVSSTNVWITIAVIAITYVTSFWVIKGAGWARRFQLVMSSAKCLFLMFAALLILGMFPTFSDQMERVWWGTPVFHDSTAYTVYVVVTWAGALCSLFILLTPQCSEWCGLSSRVGRRKILKEIMKEEKSNGVPRMVVP